MAEGRQGGGRGWKGTEGDGRDGRVGAFVLYGGGRGCYTERMLTIGEFCKREYGEKLYRLSLSAGCSCPNRDGTLGTGGCIFCSEGGSGDFAASASLPVSTQIEAAKARVAGKFRGSRYIAYFQSFTGTYGPVEMLRSRFFAAAEREDVAVVAIATRPDCLEPEKLELLRELAKVKPVWVELGLQTVKPETVAYIRRGYETAVYDRAVATLNGMGIHTVTHVILGLPGETKEDMLETVRHTVEAESAGIKLQLLHVLKGTDLAAEYESGAFATMTEDAYFDILKACVALLPEEMVVHRLTGDGPRRLLISPLWTLDKKHVISRINREIPGIAKNGP